MKKSIITITGSIGSGKSTTAKGIAAALGFTHFSGGDLQKKTADTLGLTLAEYHAKIEVDDSYDRKVEDTIAEMGRERDLVIDARLGFYSIPESFKLFLLLDPEIAAERMIKDAASNVMRDKEVPGGLQNTTQVVESIHARVESEAKRYFKYYSVTGHMDPKNFDVTINTKNNDLATVVRIAVASYKAWLEA